MLGGMSSAPLAVPRGRGESRHDRDHVVVLDGVSWDTYQALVAARGDGSVPRLCYLDGTLELMSPGFPHENDKKRLARLFERWAEEQGHFLEGHGSWTVRKKRKKGGAEADECYTLGKRGRRRPARPDIAIEVVYTSGGIDKLEVWRRLDVPEVWLWSGGTLHIHVLGPDGYESRARSALVPELDPQLLVDCMAAPSQTEAIQQLLARLRG